MKFPLFRSSVALLIGIGVVACDPSSELHETAQVRLGEVPVAAGTVVLLLAHARVIAEDGQSRELADAESLVADDATGVLLRACKGTPDADVRSLLDALRRRGLKVGFRTSDDARCT